MRGHLVVDDGAASLGEMYYRQLRFTVSHHEDVRNDTVDVMVENLLRLDDTVEFRPSPWQGLSGVLGEIRDHVSDQTRSLWTAGRAVRVLRDTKEAPRRSGPRPQSRGPAPGAHVLPHVRK